MHLLFDRVRTLDFYVRRDHFDTRKKNPRNALNGVTLMSYDHIYFHINQVFSFDMETKITK